MRLLLSTLLFATSSVSLASPGGGATCAIADISFPAPISFRDLPAAPLDIHVEGDALLDFGATGSLAKAHLDKSSGMRFVDVAVADMFKQARVGKRCLDAAGNRLIVHYRTSIVQARDTFDMSFGIERIGSAPESARP